MDVRHDDDDLARLEADPDYTAGLGVKLVRKYRRVLNTVRGVSNETGLYKHVGLHFERLKGDRQQQRSIRLVGGQRLIVEIEERPGGNCMVIKGIENYHK